MEEPMETVETTIFGHGWDAPLPAVIYMDGEEHDEKKAEIKEGFKIDDPERADWALKRWREADRELMEHVERIIAHRKKISDFEAKVRSKNKRESDFFRGLLREWATEELSKTKGKEKNIKCIEGTLTFRSATDELVYEIGDVIEAAKQNGFPQVIVTKESVSDKELRKALSEGADLPAKLIARADHFNVNFADD